MQSCLNENQPDTTDISADISPLQMYHIGVLKFQHRNATLGLTVSPLHSLPTESTDKLILQLFISQILILAPKLHY